MTTPEEHEFDRLKMVKLITIALVAATGLTGPIRTVTKIHFGMGLTSGVIAGWSTNINDKTLNENILPLNF